MAWQRTALGVGAVSALLVHHAGVRTWAAAPGVVGLLVALFLLLESEHRYERMVRRVESGLPATSRLLVRLLSGITVFLAVAALAVVVLGLT
jgi:putative membrane protein